jgi:hypothetical protein
MPGNDLHNIHGETCRPTKSGTANICSWQFNITLQSAQKAVSEPMPPKGRTNAPGGHLSTLNFLVT